MSGHNPHGRSLGQPNSSWNHLHVPSYIPRQPQLAHMSNERQIVRSPPTWHTPTPSDSLFSFMAATNHKVPLESGIIKPMIPPFVAPNMPPFGSVDLSISAARNSLTPSPRSLDSPGIASNISSPPPEFSTIIKNNPNSGPNRNLSPTPGVIQTAASVKDKHRLSPLPPPLLNNGDLNAPGLFIRDAKQINNDLVKITREPIGLPPMSKPVDLIREVSKMMYNTFNNHPMSPTRNETRITESMSSSVSTPSSPVDTQPPPQQQQQPQHHHMNHESSNVIQSVKSQSPIYNGNSTTNSTTTIVSPQLATVPSSSISSTSSSSSLSIIQPPISPPNNNVSEDSVDSNGSKKRRKRKPNKTIRMSSDSNDNCSNLESNMDSNSIKFSQNNALLDDSIGTEMAKPDPVPINDETIKDMSMSVGEIEHQATPSMQPLPPSTVATIPVVVQSTTSPSLCMSSSVSSTSSNDKLLLLNSNDNNNSNNANNNSNNANNNNNCNNNNDTSKSDADECETIDKIAEMIAKTDKNKEMLVSLSTPANKDTSQTDDTDLEKTLNGTISCDNNNLALPEKTCFEDVENKLEEMFAGIVDDRPPPPLPQSQQPAPPPPPPPPPLPQQPPTISNVSNISSVIQTASSAINANKDDGANQHREAANDNLNESVNDNLKMLGLNTTNGGGGDDGDGGGIDDNDDDDDIDKHENSDNNNVIMNEVKMTKIEDDASKKLVNSSINSVSNIKNNSSNNSNSNKGTKRGKLDDSTNLGDPLKKKKKKNNNNSTRASSSSSAYVIASSTPKTPKTKTKLTNSKAKSQSATKSKSSNSSLHRKTDVDYNDRDDVSSNYTISNSTNNNKNFRGPFVNVRPDGEISVINAPHIDEDTEKSQNKMKKITGPTMSERNQIRGLHVSTLSMKYDADTRDTSWICVFCKIGPHKNGSGDLFGPYILTTTCEEFQMSQTDPANDLFKSKRTKHDMIQKFIGGKRVDVASPVGGGTCSTATKKKKKTTLDSNTSTLPMNDIKMEATDVINVFDGMSKAGENSYEIWAHEDCAVWAPGVHIIGSRIVGLESAVWCSSRHKCAICLKYGAMLSCLYRGCSLEVHVPCAKQNNWTLNDNDFKCYCDMHKIIPTQT